MTVQQCVEIGPEHSLIVRRAGLEMKPGLLVPGQCPPPLPLPPLTDRYVNLILAVPPSFRISRVKSKSCVPSRLGWAGLPSEADGVSADYGTGFRVLPSETVSVCNALL